MNLIVDFIVDVMRVSVDRLVRSNGMILGRVSADGRSGVSSWAEAANHFFKTLFSSLFKH